MDPAILQWLAGLESSGEDLRHLIDHVAGLPFPTVDPNDSQAGARHMFNFNAAIAVDDIDIRNFDCDTGSLGRDGKPVRIEKHFLIDHVRRLYFVERIYVDPKPLMPNKKATRQERACYDWMEHYGGNLPSSSSTPGRRLKEWSPQAWCPPEWYRRKQKPACYESEMDDRCGRTEWLT